jgi:hypothetical protein
VNVTPPEDKLHFVLIAGMRDFDAIMSPINLIGIFWRNKTDLVKKHFDPKNFCMTNASIIADIT